MDRNTIIPSGIIVVVLFLLGSFAFAQILPEDPARGRQLFISKGCVNCHAIKGEGGKIGPDLGKIDLGDPQLDLAAKIWNHTPSMIIEMEKGGVIKPTLSGQEFTEISAYLYFLHFVDEPGNTTNGKRLFSEMGCSECHGLNGKRSKLMYIDLSKYQNKDPTEIVSSIWNHSIEIHKATEEKGIPWPQFKKGEMADLLEFIRIPKK